MAARHAGKDVAANVALKRSKSIDFAGYWQRHVQSA
jgi:hypothetical protein